MVMALFHALGRLPEPESAYKFCSGAENPSPTILAPRVASRNGIGSWALAGGIHRARCSAFLRGDGVSTCSLRNREDSESNVNLRMFGEKMPSFPPWNQDCSPQTVLTYYRVCYPHLIDQSSDNRRGRRLSVLRLFGSSICTSWYSNYPSSPHVN